MKENGIKTVDETWETLPIGALPYKLEDFLQMRYHSNCYRLLFRYFVPVLLGKDVFHNGMKEADLTEDNLLTHSDEAFILVTLDNNWNKWVNLFIKSKGYIAVKKGMKESDVVNSKVQPKYTKPYEDVTLPNGKRFTRKTRGWTEEGMHAYCDLYTHIKQDREDFPGFFPNWLEKERRIKKEN